MNTPASRDPWVERRALLDFMLKEHQRHGGKLIVPPNVPWSDHALLDNINPSLLIKQLQLQQGKALELAACTFSASRPTSGAGAAATAGADVSSIPTYNWSGTVVTAGPGGSSKLSNGGAAANAFLPAAGPAHTSAPESNPFLAPAQPASNPFLEPSASPLTSALQKNTTAAAAAAAAGMLGNNAAAGPTQTALTYSKKPTNPVGMKASGGSTGNGPDTAATANGAVDQGAATATRMEPRLDLSQLEAGLDDDQLRYLAYLIFAACCNNTPDAALTGVMAGQLEVDSARAADVACALQSITGAWSSGQKASLELLVKLLEVVRPTSFEGRFKGFLYWRNTVMAVLLTNLVRNVEASWTAGDKRLAKKLIARLKGALRRLDIKTLDDYDEDEYSDAVHVLIDTARKLAGSCRAGWQYPWAVRVRLSEILLGAMFDTIDQSSYIEECVRAGQFLERSLWPVLGIDPLVHVAVNTWVHFRQYVVTGEPKLVRQLKFLISKLAAETSKLPAPSDHFGLGEDAVGTDAVIAEAQQDHRLAAEIGNRIIHFTFSRLQDYHAAFPMGQNMQGLLDVLVFGTKARGDTEDKLASLLVALVQDSVTAEYQRRAKGLLAEKVDEEMRLLALAQLVRDLQMDEGSSFSGIISAHLPQQMAVSCARLYTLYGRQLQPWLATVPKLDDLALQLLRTLLKLDLELWDIVAAALQQPQEVPSSLRAALQEAQRWDVIKPLQQAQMVWVRSQVDNMHTWISRQLLTEKWRAIGSTEAYSQSAVEASKLIHDVMEALFDMGLPVQADVVMALLDGIDSALQRYAQFVNDKLGPTPRLVPPLPPITRYKKPEAVKLEAQELEGRAKSSGSGVAALKSMKSMFKSEAPKEGATFTESVPKIEVSPDYTTISQSLTTPIIVTCIASLDFLQRKTDFFVETVQSKWTDRQHVESSTGGTAAKQLPQEMLVTARQALKTGAVYGCKFLAVKVTFWDLRLSWLELLYRHHVTSQRIGFIIEKLEQELAEACPVLSDELRTQFALALLKESIKALERVLLDGGPCRWFITADVALLEQDLLQLRNLFYADGEGLPRDAIEAELEPIYKLLKPMALETGPLMDLLKQAKQRGTAVLSAQGQSLVYEEGVIMRILARRPERTGSKVLKKDYKLSKKIK